MTKQVIWTKLILETFIEEANLTTEEEMIMRTRCQGWTITKQAMEFGMSPSSVSRTVARLKKKYDAVQKTNLILPPRKNSAQETYMDEN